MSKSRTLFFNNVLQAVEKQKDQDSRNNQIRLIQRFFNLIGGCTVTPPRLLPDVEASPNVEAFIAAFIERMSVDEEFFYEYFNLITYKLGLGSAVGLKDVEYIRNNIIGRVRQDSFIATGGVSGSNYIEDLLYDLLNTTDQYDDINECVNLLMCPLKVYFKLFIDFTRPRDPRNITPEMAEKYFKIFMDKSELIIIKKLELIDFLKMQTAHFKFDDDIINVLTTRFIMCLEFFKSTMSRAGFSKELYDTVLEQFNSSHDLRDYALGALGILKGRLFTSIIILQVKEERSEEENEQLALFRERKIDVDRMIADLNKLIPLINASSDLFHQNSQLTNAATVQDTAVGRLQRRQQQQQEQEQRRQPSQHDNVGGRKRQKKCKNTKKCKNKKKSSRNKKKLSRNKKKS
jgi:hypothetical protein